MAQEYNYDSSSVNPDIEHNVSNRNHPVHFFPLDRWMNAGYFKGNYEVILTLPEKIVCVCGFDFELRKHYDYQFDYSEQRTFPHLISWHRSQVTCKECNSMIDQGRF
jgi:hypothetical protein